MKVENNPNFQAINKIYRCIFSLYLKYLKQLIMKHSLEPLRTSVLTNMEGGQLLKRHLNDLRTIDPALLTDPIEFARHSK